jgi:hypothetical protein
MFFRAATRLSLSLAVISTVLVVTGGSPASAAIERSWTTGDLRPQFTRSFTINVASPTAAYDVGLGPIGGTVDDPCWMGVSSMWYTQPPGGTGRQFKFNITNVGDVTCSTKITLGLVEPFRSWSTGTLNPGAVRGWNWNNANPLDSVYMVGLTPSGSSSTTACELQVERVRYTQQVGGEREFSFRVRNVGDVACGGDVQLARQRAVETSSDNLAFEAGQAHWTAPLPITNGNPDTVPVIGLSPQDAAKGPCVFQLGAKEFYHLPEMRGVFYEVTNVGSFDCSVETQYTRL